LIFVNVFNKMINESAGDVLVFPIFFGLSGTYQTFCIAKDMVVGNIHICDS